MSTPLSTTAGPDARAGLRPSPSVTVANRGRRPSCVRSAAHLTTPLRAIPLQAAFRIHVRVGTLYQTRPGSLRGPLARRHHPHPDGAARADRAPRPPDPAAPRPPGAIPRHPGSGSQPARSDRPVRRAPRAGGGGARHGAGARRPTTAAYRPARRSARARACIANALGPSPDALGLFRRALERIGT